MTKEDDAVHRMYGQQKIQQQDDDYTSLKKKKNENKWEGETNETCQNILWT